MPSDDCQNPPPEPADPDTLAALLDADDAAFDELLEQVYPVRDAAGDEVC